MESTGVSVIKVEQLTLFPEMGKGVLGFVCFRFQWAFQPKLVSVSCCLLKAQSCLFSRLF